MPCPEEYRNLGLKSFGEQKYVTADMLRQFCKNDAFLKKMVDQLEYLTPPAVRKVFTSIPVDDVKSYGYTVTEKNTIVFDDTHDKTLTFDFNDLSVVDDSKTTAVRTSIMFGGEVIQKFEVPKELKTTIDSTTRDYSPWTIRDDEGKIVSDDMTCNEFWYIGFDRNRHYETRPNWLKNMLNPEIPGISRAQTFKAKKTGLLQSVRLNLHGSTNTGMPLVVQIRKTRLEDGIYVPVNSAEKMIASQDVVFWQTDPGVYSVTFDYPGTVTKDEHYAIVLVSPLSHPTNCYWVGGWNKHCHADQYPDGDAFYSFNSGYTWTRYGKDDWETGEEVEYHQGKYAPQDFAFICDIAEQKTNYKTNPHYLYLKPILSNPIRSVTLSAISGGESATAGRTLKFQVSPNGRVWQDITNTIEFTEPTRALFVRAIFTSDGNQTPYVEEISLHLDMEVSDEMYVRTVPYAPPLTGILSANVWGRVYAPFRLEPNTECTVEIIREKEVTEHFIIIDAVELVNYNYFEEIALIYNDIVGKNQDQMMDYLRDKPSLIASLKNRNIYIRGFIDKFQFTNKPAYPILRSAIQPSGAATEIYGEWYDYLVDYDNNTLKFFDDIQLPKGSLDVTYNPVFIEGLTNEEVGLRADKTEGLILDYFEESIIVDEDMVTDRRIELKAEPVDPIRKVVVVKDDYTEHTLVENIDYYVDEKTIVLEIINFDGESPIISVNDTVKIVYTPNLDDNSISIGYYAKRTNTDNTVEIQPNYIEYKA